MTTKQLPIHSGFGAKTTAREILANRDLHGVTAIVTGGHGGVGLETTRALANAGATVIVGSRDVDRARVAVDGIPRVEIDTLDLIDPASIDAFAGRFLASGRSIQMLINNAGIMATPLARESRGFDSQFATNHLGHFQLTARLWPALSRANGARVVSLTSRRSRHGVGSISTIRGSNDAPTTNGSRTVNRRRRTRSSPSLSTRAPRRGHAFRCTRAPWRAHVVATSRGHAMGSVDLGDPRFERRPW